MDLDDAARLVQRLRALPDEELAVMVGTDRGLYEPAALRHAEAEVARRGGWTGLRHRPPDPAPLACPSCGTTAAPAVTPVVLPANTPDGVAAFEARSCTACGRTVFFLA